MSMRLPEVSRELGRSDQIASRASFDVRYYMCDEAKDAVLTASD